jgi:hypothetical protein
VQCVQCVQEDDNGTKSSQHPETVQTRDEAKQQQRAIKVGVNVAHPRSEGTDSCSRLIF